MMIPLWMNTETPPHIVAEARVRLKVDLEKKGLIEGHGKFTTVFQRKLSKYIAIVYDELRKNPWLEKRLLQKHNARRTTSRARTLKVTRM